MRIPPVRACRSRRGLSAPGPSERVRGEGACVPCASFPPACVAASCLPISCAARENVSPLSRDAKLGAWRPRERGRAKARSPEAAVGACEFLRRRLARRKAAELEGGKLLPFKAFLSPSSSLVGPSLFIRSKSDLLRRRALIRIRRVQNATKTRIGLWERNCLVSVENTSWECLEFLLWERSRSECQSTSRSECLQQMLRRRPLGNLGW